MGLFSKESKTSFKRDEKGNVVAVERTENKPLFGKRESKTPVYDAAMKKYYKEQPEKKTTYKAKEIGRGLVASFDRMADNYVKNAKQHQKKIPTSMRYHTPVRHTYKIKNNYNPFGTLFDTGMKTPPKIKEKERYVIRGGKAYPIARPSTPKKTKKTKGFDMFDNYGFFK